MLHILQFYSSNFELANVGFDELIQLFALFFGGADNRISARRSNVVDSRVIRSMAEIHHRNADG